ncbi:MAG: thioredoxin family protein [Pseudomonadota bacterium]
MTIKLSLLWRLFLGVILLIPISSVSANLSVLGKNQHVWYQKSASEAFEESSKTQKPVFLYWGAAWCPTCNVLKDAVFNQPKFPELMSALIPVYLDGDTEEAQTWSDKLKTVGYPTILIIAPGGKELARVSGSLDIEEFEQVINQAVASQGITQVITQALNNKLAPEAWKQLAYLDWISHYQNTHGEQKTVDTALQLLENFPSSLPLEKSVLQLNTLSWVMQWEKTNSLSTTTQNLIKKQVPFWLQNAFASKDTAFANRYFITREAQSTSQYLNYQAKQPAYEALKKRWIQSSQQLAIHPKADTYTRMWSVSPLIDFALFENPNQLPNKAIKQRVIEQVKQSEEAVNNRYESHFITVEGAKLLALVGDDAAAEALLKRGLKTTKTPWYLQSKIANLRAKQGDISGALEWSEKARESSQGRATRLQWIATDIQMTAKYFAKPLKTRLLNLVDDYFKQAFALNDGFSGRNYIRSKTMIEALQKVSAQVPELNQKFASLQKQCNAYSATAACQQYFAQW